MFAPDRAVLKELRRTCQSGGVAFADCEWSPVFRCLCIMFRDFAFSPWYVWEPLRGDDGEPRQINHEDVRCAWMAGLESGEGLRRLETMSEREAQRDEMAGDQFLDRVLRGFQANARWASSKTLMGGQQVGGRRDSAVDSDFQPCEHGEKVRQECQICHPWRMRQVFSQASKSGAASNGYLLRDSRRRFDEAS